MKRYLVVANQTLGGEHLLAEVHQRMEHAGGAEFHVVVPASHTSDGATWTEGEARALGQARLDEALARLRDVGATVTGELGDDSPVEAVSDALREAAYDEIILSTLPPGVSRWLRQDVMHRIRRRHPGVPLTHVIAPAHVHAR